MTDSDSDSFHSATEGDDIDFDDIPQRKSPLITSNPTVAATNVNPVIDSPKEDKDVVPNVVEDDKSINMSQKSDDSSSITTESKSSSSDVLKSDDSSNNKQPEGWGDFGDDADTEGEEDESEDFGIETVESNKGGLSPEEKRKVLENPDIMKEPDPSDEEMSDVERIESDEGEYYHRQMLDRKMMPPPPLPEKRGGKSREPTDRKNSGGGLFDWSAIHNVVSAVGEGISNAVETGLGLPPPEEAARLSVAERRKILEESQRMKEPEPSLSSDEGGGVSPEGSIHGLPIHHARTQSGNGFSSFFGGFGSIVNGGLDVLENLGKKTFETLTVKDEQEKRRFILQPGKDTNLSDILRELKESEDNAPNNPKMLAYGSTVAANTGISFLKEFEDNDGLVHLECFELLSKDYFAEKVANKKFVQFDEKLSAFCLEDVSECSTDEFSKGIKKQTANFIPGFKPTPITDTNDELTKILTDLQDKVDIGEEITVDEFHKYAIVALAKLTSKAIECLCRLVQQMIVSQSRPEIDALFTFTYLICRRLSFFASQYANLLSLLKQDSKNEEAVTNIFFECTNACLYLKKALELARPFMPDDGYIFNPNVPEIKDTTTVKRTNKVVVDDGGWDNW